MNRAPHGFVSALPPFAASHRIILETAPPDSDPAELLPIFNSNPSFLRTSGYPSRFSRSDVQAYLLEETMRENSICLFIRLKEGLKAIGTAALQVPNPSDGIPWIGLLILEASCQRKGFGREAALLLESQLVAQSYPAARVSVLRDNEVAKNFWTGLGFVPISEATDSSGRAAWRMEKSLDPAR